MNLSSNIKFVDEKLKKSLEELEIEKTQDKNLQKWLIRAFEDIEENAFCGIQVPKKLIPKEYPKKYNIHNLWKYNLPDAWRLLYSIENQEIVIVSIVLEWLTHKEYEKRFKY